MIYFESQDLGPLLFLSEGLTIMLQTATPDDLLDPMTALLSHPKWLVVNEEFSGGIDSLMSVLAPMLRSNYHALY